MRFAALLIAFGITAGLSPLPAARASSPDFSALEQSRRGPVDRWRIEGRHLHDPLFYSRENGPWISADGLLIAQDFGFPAYPREWSAWIANLVGLQNYSDLLYSSTIMAWSAKVAVLAGDRPEAERILTDLQRMAVRDGVIGEIYRYDRAREPFRTWGFQSEAPFSWGSATILDALRTLAGYEN